MVPSLFLWALLVTSFAPLVAIDRLFDDNVSIDCTLPMGAPLNSLVEDWYFNSSPLDTSNAQKYSQTSDRRRLTIQQVQYSDEGGYQCVFTQNGQRFQSSVVVLRIVGTPVFSSCLQSSCMEMPCTIFGSSISLNFGISFIKNTVSMIEGPYPQTLTLCRRRESGECATVISCITEPVRSCANQDQERFTYNNEFPNNLSITISSLTEEFSGTYIAIASVQTPSSATLILNKTITIYGCSNLSDPPGGSVMVNGCSATYSCDNPMTAEGDVTRQCLQSNEWSGTELTCTHGNQNNTGFIATDTTTSATNIQSSSMFTPTRNATSATVVQTETESSVLLITILSATVPTIVMIAIIAIAATVGVIFFVWRFLKKEGRMNVHSPGKLDMVISNEVKSVTFDVSGEKHKKMDVKEGGRNSVLEDDNNIELPEQNSGGFEYEAHV